MNDPIIRSLNQLNPNIEFVEAPHNIIAQQASKHKERASKWVLEGQIPTDINVAVPDLQQIITANYQKVFAHCHILCKANGRNLSLAVYNDDGRQRLSKQIFCQGAEKKGADASCFIWIGPKADILTPWSDNDKPQCQVITLAVLQDFARQYRPEKKY